MEPGGFLLKNQSLNAVSISASNTAENYDIKSILNDIPGDCFISSNNDVIIDIEFPDIISFSGIAIINHNFSDTTTVNVSISNTSIIELTDNFIIHDTWYQRIIEKKDENGKLNEVLAANLWKDVGKFAKYIRLEISSNEPIRIGTLFLPRIKFQFPKNYQWDYEKTFRVNKDMDCVNGHFFEDGISEQFGYKLIFSKISEAYYEEFLRIFRVGPKVFIPFWDAKQCYHGVIVDEFTKKTSYNFNDTFSVNFWENAF